MNKKFILILIICLSCILISCRQEEQIEYQEISKITYQVRNGLSGYDSTRTIDLQNYLIYDTNIVQNDYEEFPKIEHVSDIDKNIVQTFIKEIIDAGILSLTDENKDDDYMISDASFWYLTVYLKDGTTYKVDGYHKTPQRFEKINDICLKHLKYSLKTDSYQIYTTDIPELTPLTDQELEMLQEDYYKKLGKELYFTNFLGFYNNCYVYFTIGIEDVVSVFEVAGYEFYCHSSFSINVYNGIEQSLEEAYHNRLINDYDVYKIWIYYQEIFNNID